MTEFLRREVSPGRVLAMAFACAVLSIFLMLMLTDPSGDEPTPTTCCVAVPFKGDTGG